MDTVESGAGRGDPLGGEAAYGLLSALNAGPGCYQGRGTNHEQESFVGRLEVQRLLDGQSVLLHYTATRDDGLILHREATLLGRSAQTRLCLWPVMMELPVVIPHPLAQFTALADGTLRGVFASGPRLAVEQFREEIVLEVLPGERLVVAHSWGMPGGPFAERSSALLRPAQA